MSYRSTLTVNNSTLSGNTADLGGHTAVDEHVADTPARPPDESPRLHAIDTAEDHARSELVEIAPLELRATDSDPDTAVDRPTEILDSIVLEPIEVSLQESLRRQILGFDGVRVNQHERARTDSSKLKRHLPPDGADADHVGDGVSQLLWVRDVPLPDVPVRDRYLLHVAPLLIPPLRPVRFPPPSDS